MTNQAIEEYLETERERFLVELFELLRIPSISTNVEYRSQCFRCAEWLRDHLAALGFAESRLLETSANPVVYAEHFHHSGAPTLLFYGHYDVQPPDPLEAWLSPPFEPEVRDGRVYARGAQDDKGQIFYLLKAFEYCLKQSSLGCNIKVLFEGEEETGSAGPFENLERWRDLLQCDALVVADTQMIDIDTPTITIGLRGMIACDLTVSGPNYDLHSGHHGGRVLNPLAEICKALSSLYRPDGSIAVEGYGEGLVPLSDVEQRHFDQIPFDEAQYTVQVGLPPTGGERDLPPLERGLCRPSIDLNGLSSGYAGPGAKTIVPMSATAKLSSRLAYDQNPLKCAASLEHHLRSQIPQELKVSFNWQLREGFPLRISPEAKSVAFARSLLRRQFGREPVLNWSGVSIPVVSKLARVSNAEPLLVGFGTEEGKVHSPNESFSIRQIEMGFRYAVGLLEEYR